MLPYEWFDQPDKLQKTELPPHEAFHNKIRSCKPLKADYTDYVNFLKSELTTEQEAIKWKLSKPPATGIDIYQHLQQMWKKEQVSSSKDFLRSYSKICCAKFGSNAKID